MCINFVSQIIKIVNIDNVRECTLDGDYIMFERLLTLQKLYDYAR